MMMPNMAITPSMATKPKGWPNSSSVATTPIRPSGAVSTTIMTREKLLQLHHQQRQHHHQHDRHLGVDRVLALGAFLDGAADLDAIADRQLLAQRVQLLVEGVGHVDALGAGDHVGLHRDGGLAVALPDHRVFQAVAQLPQAAQRHGAVGVGMASVARRAGSTRSRGARSSTLISLSRSRYCVTV